MLRMLRSTRLVDFRCIPNNTPNQAESHLNFANRLTWKLLFCYPIIFGRHLNYNYLQEPQMRNRSIHWCMSTGKYQPGSDLHMNLSVNSIGRTRLNYFHTFCSLSAQRAFDESCWQRKRIDTRFGFRPSLETRSDHPERAAGLQRPTRGLQPGIGELIVTGEVGELVPVVVDRVDLGVVGTQQVAAQLEVIGRVGEDHVDAGVGQGSQYLDAVAAMNDVGLELGHGNAAPDSLETEW